MTLEELTETVLTISPQLMDAREATALVESCGVNDRIATSDFGMPTTFIVGEYILRTSRTGGIQLAQEQVERASKTSLLQEARSATYKFSLNFAYALPWSVLLVIEYVKPKLLQLSPEWGGILSLSLIASLISAGGFSQAIARTGYFYIGMKEPKLALRICLLFVKWGCFVCAAFGLIGFMLAHYFGLFPVLYLLWGSLNFLMLSALWMFCAMLSVQNRVWRIPLVFLFGAVAFVLLHPDFGVIIPLFAANAVSLGCAAAFAIIGFESLPSTNPPGTPTPPMPRLPVVAFMLLPFFFYGLLYFAFLFADRIAAGSAIPWASGLSFGIDSQYKQGMDVALFIFLVLAAVVEYMADRFSHYWFEIVEYESDVTTLLQRRYYRSLVTVCYLFGVLAAGLWFAYHHFQHKVAVTAVLGSVGYFFVALALFNLIVLFTLNRAERALALLALALACNGITGYVLSHVFGVEYAAIGLLVGGFVLLVVSYRVIQVVLREADYFYALA